MPGEFLEATCSNRSSQLLVFDSSLSLTMHSSQSFFIFFILFDVLTYEANRPFSQELQTRKRVLFSSLAKLPHFLQREGAFSMHTEINICPVYLHVCLSQFPWTNRIKLTIQALSPEQKGCPDFRG